VRPRDTEGGDVSAPERRQTPTERYHEAMLAFAARTAAPPESAIDITRNAKGDYQYTVTVRGHDPDAALAKALELSDAIAAKYPRSES
jgi:hypothetical protein